MGAKARLRSRSCAEGSKRTRMAYRLEGRGDGHGQGVEVGVEGWLCAGFGGEADDEDGEEHDGDDVDAAFGAGCAAGEQRVARGVGVEEAAGAEDAAVRNAVEEALCPVPRHVEADGPPQRTGAPEGVAEDDGGKEGHHDAHGIFVGVGEMACAEDERHEECGDPEGDEASIRGGDFFGEAEDAAGEGELKEAAAEVLLKEANGEEGKQPLDAEGEDG